MKRVLRFTAKPPLLIGVSTFVSSRWKSFNCDREITTRMQLGGVSWLDEQGHKYWSDLTSSITGDGIELFKTHEIPSASGKAFEMSLHGEDHIHVSQRCISTLRHKPTGRLRFLLSRGRLNHGPENLLIFQRDLDLLPLAVGWAVSQCIGG